MPIDKKQLIPFLKGIAEGYDAHPCGVTPHFNVARVLFSAVERIEAGEFDEVEIEEDQDPVWMKEWANRYEDKY